MAVPTAPPGGKVVQTATGYATYAPMNGGFQVTNYHADGSVDTTAQNGGIVPASAVPAGGNSAPAIGSGPIIPAAGTAGSPINPTTAAQSVTAMNDRGGVIGADLGYTPSDLVSNINNVNQTNQGLINAAAAQGQNNLNAAAAVNQQAGQNILKTGYGQQAYQQAQGAQGLQQGQQMADYNTMLGQQAMGGMSALGGQANDASAFYGGQGVQQMANAGQDRAAQLQQIAGLNQYIQQGPGPSAAQAQLQMANNQTQANNLSLANSGRGAGDAAQAQRMAMFANAATQQTTNQQMAQLRAQEEADWRSKQLQGMGMAQGTIGNLQGADIGAANAAGGLGAQYAGLAKDYYGAGINAQGAAAGQANQALGTGQGYNAQMANAGNTAAGQGINAYDSLAGQANDLTKSSTGLGVGAAGLNAAGNTSSQEDILNLAKNQAGNDVQKFGIVNNVGIQQQAQDNAKTGAYIQGAAALAGGVALAASDVRGKKNIVPVVNHFRHTVTKPMDRMNSIARLSDGR